MAKTQQKDLVANANDDANALLALGVDFGADSGAGMEGADRDSYAIPFLRVLQKGSPQCDEATPQFIEGAKAGMFYNSVTGRMYDGKVGVTFLPCAFQRRFLRWGPRGGDGAGFRGELLPEEVAAMRDSGKIAELDGRLYVVDANGEVNEKKCDRIVDTRNHFGLLVDGTDVMQVLLTLSSTQIKKSKQLMSMLSNAKVKTPNGMVVPPTWASKILITTLPESNDQGSWHGVKFEQAGFIGDKDLYEAGRAFHEAISAGEVKANFAEAREEQVNSDDRKF